MPTDYNKNLSSRMQSIRKLIQNRKDEERKHKETLVLVDRPDCRPQLTISIDDVLKFSSVGPVVKLGSLAVCRQPLQRKRREAITLF